MNGKIDKIIKKEINESRDYINLLNKRIAFYKHRIDFLNNNKPCFFEINKLKNWRVKIEEFNEKIEKAYMKIGLEEEMIMKMQIRIK